MNYKNPSNVIAVPLKKNKIIFAKQNRSHIKSLGDVLDAIREAGRSGIVISSISRKANLAHYSALDKCSKLISAGLIQSTVIDDKKVYVITEKGLDFFQEYQNFQNLVEPLNLKY